MKKILLLSVTLLLLCALIACDTHRINHKIRLPRYEKEEYFTDPDGFSEFVDHAKYYYTENSIKEFEKCDDFITVTDGDIEKLRSYIRDFTLILNDVCERGEELDFRETQIKPGDLFCLIQKGDVTDARPLGDYALYYVDRTQNILYFFWLNI